MPEPKVTTILHHANGPSLRSTTCLECGHPISGVSPRGILDAMHAHADYVNTTKDPASDPHFAENRLTALVQP